MYSGPCHTVLMTAINYRETDRPSRKRTMSSKRDIKAFDSRSEDERMETCCIEGMEGWKIVLIFYLGSLWNRTQFKSLSNVVRKQDFKEPVLL
jgi:hypothetical protein